MSTGWSRDEVEGEAEEEGAGLHDPQPRRDTRPKGCHILCRAKQSVFEMKIRSM